MSISNQTSFSPSFTRLELSEQVFDYILNRILYGDLKVGEKINIEAIARDLKVSRTPVREAFRKLEQMDLVVAIPFSGFQVKQLSIEEIHEIYQIRILLEVYAIRESAKKITPDQLDHIISIQKKMEQILESENHSNQQILVCNREFHMAIFKTCSLPLLCEMIETLWNRLSFFRLLLIQEKSYGSRSMQEHWQYIEALRCHNADECDALTRRTLQNHDREMPNLVNKYYKSLKNYQPRSAFESK